MKWRSFFNSTLKELSTAKVEIDARIQHEMKITRELRASNEEKSRFEMVHKDLQVWV